MGKLKVWPIVLLFFLVQARTPSAGDINDAATPEPAITIETVPTPTLIPVVKTIKESTAVPTNSPGSEATLDPSENVDSGGPVILLRQEGGFAGVDNTYVIHPNGRVELNSEYIGTLDAAKHQEVLKKIEESGFYELSIEAAEGICCDFFTYTLMVTDGDLENSITLSENDPQMPKDLERIILELLGITADLP